MLASDDADVASFSAVYNFGCDIHTTLIIINANDSIDPLIINRATSGLLHCDNQRKVYIRVIGTVT